MIRGIDGRDNYVCELTFEKSLRSLVDPVRKQGNFYKKQKLAETPLSTVYILSLSVSPCFCLSIYLYICRSISKTHYHVAGTLSNQQTTVCLAGWLSLSLSLPPPPPLSLSPLPSPSLALTVDYSLSLALTIEYSISMPSQNTCLYRVLCFVIKKIIDGKSVLSIYSVMTLWRHYHMCMFMNKVD